MMAWEGEALVIGTRSRGHTWGPTLVRLLVVLLSVLSPVVSPLPKAEITACPFHCRCLEKGSVITCRYAGLHRLPDLLSTTMFLDFDHNHVSVIRNVSFRHTPHIEMLSFQDNQIQDILPRAFDDLPDLHTLVLRNNLISSLPAHLFNHNPQLQVLDLSQNLFTVIPDYLIQPLLSLQVFNLSFNHLDSPHLGRGFSYTKQLEVLDLSGNNFMSLEQKAFRVVQSWNPLVSHSLNLSQCNIHHIHPRTLQNLLSLNSLSLAGNPAISTGEIQASMEDLSNSRLRKLNLAGVNISSITEFFQNFQHQDLEHLDLSHNRIQLIQRGTFYYLEELQHLDLSHNAIGSVDDFASLSKLTYLDLSYNELHYIDSTSLESLHNLFTLDMSHNKLTQLDDEPFSNLFYLRDLDISHNKISRIIISSGMESLLTLQAQNNILSDLSFVAQLRHLEYLDLSNNVVQQLGPSFLPRGQHMTILNISGNSIHDVHTNTFHMSTQDVVDLSDNQIASLSHPGWSHVKKLYLSKNLLYNLSANAFSGLDTLEELYLGYNHLVALARGTLDELSSLKVLDLRHNPIGIFLSAPDTVELTGMNHLMNLQVLSLAGVDIHSVPHALLANLTSLRTLDLSRNYISELRVDAVSHLKHLNVINLSKNQLQTVDPVFFQSIKNLRTADLSLNPFDCSCDLMPFRTWAISTLSDADDNGVSVSGLHNSGQYQCFSPPEWRSVPLLNFHLDSASCTTRERVVLLAAIACVMLALSLTVIIGVLRYKWWHRRKDAARRTTVQEYTFVDDSSTAALTGNQTLSMNSTTQTIKEWV